MLLCHKDIDLIWRGVVSLQMLNFTGLDFFHLNLTLKIYTSLLKGLL